MVLGSDRGCRGGRGGRGDVGGGVRKEQCADAAGRGVLMRYWLVAVLAGGGGSAPDPCAGKSGTCIAAHVDGNAHDLTQARVTLPDGRVTTTQATSGAIKMPSQFAIVIADNVPGSPFALQLDGIRGGTIVATDTE